MHTFDIHPDHDHLLVRFVGAAGTMLEGRALTLAGAHWIANNGRPAGATRAEIIEDGEVFDTVVYPRKVIREEAGAGRQAKKVRVRETA